LRAIVRAPHATLSDDDARTILAAAAARSDHPQSRAIAAALASADREGATRTAVSVDAARAVAGGGLLATVRLVAQSEHRSHSLMLGSPRFVASRAFAGVEPAAAAAASAHGEKAPLSVLAVDGHAQATLVFSEEPRAEADQAIAALREVGVEPMLASGDRGPVVAAFASRMGIAVARGDLLPADKVEWIEQQRRDGRVVAMVGDGINDAPALAVCDVGFALAGGADVAQEAAPIVLLRSDLRAVAFVVRLSRRTRRVIRQNLGWAFGYNALMLPLAALGVLSPMVSAAAMAASSITVVVNSLRLRR
jgi:P-type E1-E2 ATPase